MSTADGFGREATLSERDFRRLSRFINEQCGIMVPDSKRPMLAARIQKRLRSLGLRSAGDYVDQVMDTRSESDELIHFIDIVTTNKSEFFREQTQLEYLVQEAIPDLIKNLGAGVRRPLSVWSAGCAAGEEPYTLAIVLREFTERFPGIGLRSQILATDISSRVLEGAAHAIYPMEKISAMPVELKKKYLLKSKDRGRREIRVIPEVRDMVRFRRLNFMDDDFALRERMDIIFCRNVMVYFDRATQETLIGKFLRYLMPGGYLFLDRSESLNGFHTPLVRVAPAIYRHPV